MRPKVCVCVCTVRFCEWVRRIVFCNVRICGFVPKVCVTVRFCRGYKIVLCSSKSCEWVQRSLCVL